MTQALSRANWIWTPSLCQPLLETLLRVAAMLWVNVAATFWMIASLLAGDWHTDAEPRDLPGEMRDISNKETDLADNSSETIEALILRAHAVRVSKDEGELTAASHVAAPMGVSSRKCEALSGTHSPSTTHAGPWVPALRRFAPPAGMTAVSAVKILPRTRAPASS